MHALSLLSNLYREILMNIYFETLLLLEVLTAFLFFVVLFVSVRHSSSMRILLDGVMDSSDSGTIIFNRRGRFRGANKYARFALSEVIDGEIDDVSIDYFRKRLAECAADIDDSVESTFLEDALCARGSSRDVVSFNGDDLFLVEVKDLKGGLILFTLTNISVKQTLEEDLEHLNDFNNQLIQAIQATTSGVVISDPKFDSNPILFVNDAFCEYVNCKRSNLIGANWSVVLGMIRGQDDKKKFMKALNNAKEMDLAIERVIDGDMRYFSMKLTPVRDGDGGLDLFIGVMSEITLLKQRESEFFHVQKLESLGQLAAGVAHDFNNILSIIGGYSLMSANKLECTTCDESEEIRGYLQKIDKAADRGASLTRKMLTFSRHKVVSQSVINIVDIVNEQRELLLPLLGVSVDLKVNVPDMDVNIQGVSDSVSQVIMNFVVNGRDAMPAGGTMTIDVKCMGLKEVPKNVHQSIGADDYACISVSDMGSGMDEATIEKMFDPFFSTKDQGKGTGLGLSVVYGLVKEMGGVLDVASILGTGTVMSFYAPLSNEEQTKKVTGSLADLSTISLRGYTALVAEDEPDLLLLVTSMLENLGMNVLGALDGDEALVLLDDNIDEIDILLTDIVMPGLNGVKLVELVTALSPDIKTIFMSGYPANGDMAPVEMPEGAKFIAKPVDYKALAALILKEVGGDVSSEGACVDLDSMPQWGVSSNMGGSNV